MTLANSSKDEATAHRLAKSTSKSDTKLQYLGTEAIEQLACGLTKAALTIQEVGQNACDEEKLKQLNDEQLFQLLEEAYHSKKLDEDKNKNDFFKEILEDVHDSIAVSSCREDANRPPPDLHSRSGHVIRSWPPTSSTIVTSSSHNSHFCRRPSGDDSSSTKTEIEEIDQLSDFEEQHQPKRYPEENCSSSCSSFSLQSRQLRPLSIYRHNPAFHSQRVPVNQIEVSPPPQPSASTLNQHSHHHYQNSRPGSTGISVHQEVSGDGASAVAADGTTSRFAASKSRRKKKAVSKDTIKAEDVDGYRGRDDIDSILQFIESTPEKSEDKRNKRSRKTDSKRSKRSRTPSATSRKEASLEPEKSSPPVAPPSNPTEDLPIKDLSEPPPENSLPVCGVASSAKPPKPGKPNRATSVGTLISSYITSGSGSSSSRCKAVHSSIKSQCGRNKSLSPVVKHIEHPHEAEEQIDESEDTVEVAEQIVVEGSPREQDNHAEVDTPAMSKRLSPVIVVQVSVEPDESSSVQENEAVCRQKEEVQQPCPLKHPSKFNYDSILQFVKHEWDVVTLEISNGSTEIQSKIVYYKPHLTNL